MSHSRKKLVELHTLLASVIPNEAWIIESLNVDETTLGAVIHPDKEVETIEVKLCIKRYHKLEQDESRQS